VKYLKGERHPSDCFSRNPCEWNHRTLIDDDPEDILMDSENDDKEERVIKTIAFVYCANN